MCGIVGYIGREPRAMEVLIDGLRRHPDLVIGDNQPYSGSLPGDTMWTYGIERGLPHVLIEVRNDLIADRDGQHKWAALLSAEVGAAVAEMRARDQTAPRVPIVTEEESAQ